MNLLRIVARIFFSIALLGKLCAYEVCDSTGKKFEFNVPPKVISLSPAISETICAIGADDSLLAVSKFCNYPAMLTNNPEGRAIFENLSKKEKVGGFIDADFEKILTIKPNLVILHDVSADFLKKKFKGLGVDVFFVYADGLENIAKNTELFGTLFNRDEKAQLVADKIRKKTAFCEVQKRPKAIFLFENMAASVDTYAGQLLQNCGFENVVRGTKAAWAVLPKEYILLSAPEVLILKADSESDFEIKKAALKKDAVWSKTPAVKKGKVFMMPTDLIITPSPRIIYAAEVLHKIRAELNY